MILTDSRLLNTYMEHDSLLEVLKETAQGDDEKFTSHKWLMESPPKRMLYFYMYGGFPISHRKSSILDVGGGYCSYTRKLLEIADYKLLDVMTHDDHEMFEDTVKAIGQDFWINSDWGDYVPDREYDLIIANDLFPNVDQRLDGFLRKYLPHCRELRMSLTFYNTPKWYKVKRLNGDEIFTQLAWNGGQVRETLQRYQQSFVIVPHWELFDSMESVFPNGRQVCIIKLIGELA
jgi:hypothetical protein